MFDTYKESDYEQAVMELFGGLDYQTVYAPDIERDFKSPLYDEVLEAQILKLNPTLPQEAIDNALYKLRNFDNGELVKKNETLAEWLKEAILTDTADEAACSLELIRIGLGKPATRVNIRFFATKAHVCIVCAR